MSLSLAYTCPPAGGDSSAAALVPDSPSPGPQDTCPEALALMPWACSRGLLPMETCASSPPPLHPAFGPHHAFPTSTSPSLRSPFAPHSPDSPQPQHRSHPPFDAHTLFSSWTMQSQAVPQLTPHPAGLGGPAGVPVHPQASGVPSGHPGMLLSPGSRPSQALV